MQDSIANLRDSLAHEHLLQRAVELSKADPGWLWSMAGALIGLLAILAAVLLWLQTQDAKRQVAAAIAKATKEYDEHLERLRAELIKEVAQQLEGLRESVMPHVKALEAELERIVADSRDKADGYEQRYALLIEELERDIARVRKLH